MNAAQILSALEREQQLLREFRSLSEQQLQLLDTEDLAGVNQLLDHRADLMLELSAVETTLGTWIDQIQSDPMVSKEMFAQLRAINDDIIQMADRVVEIDEETHWRLDFIKSRAGSELRTLNKGARALQDYERAWLG